MEQICKNCGAILATDDKYCTQCGSKTQIADTMASKINTPNNIQYCTHCGKQIMREAVVCVHCGCPTVNKRVEEDRADGGLMFLSFLIPLAGIILWAINKEQKPKAAKKYLWTGLITWITAIIVYAIYYALVIDAVSSAYDEYLFILSRNLTNL